MNSTIGYIEDRPAMVVPSEPTYSGDYAVDLARLQWAEHWSPRSTFNLREWQVWQVDVDQSMSDYEWKQGQFSDYAGHLSGNFLPMPNFAGV